MEDEIEDIIGDVKLTDSQKSVAISNVYSPDFTDSSSSDRNNSSGKDTYTIEQDDSDAKPFQLRSSRSVINLSVHKDEITQCDVTKKISRAAPTGLYGCSFVSQEVFTQTSKTIIELAEMERNHRINHGTSLDTQTSFISITNKTVEYRIELSNNAQSVSTTDAQKVSFNSNKLQFLANEQILGTSLNDDSFNFLVSGTGDDLSNVSEDKVLNILEGESTGNILCEEQYENTSDFSSSNSDIEEDSLLEYRKRKVETDTASDISEIPKSVANDVEELYNKLSESIDLHNFEKCNHHETHKFSSMTPLTEESAIEKDNLMDITPDIKNIVHSVEDDKDVLFTSNAGTRVKILPIQKSNTEDSTFKLPSITNRSCPSSPHLNFLFSDNPNRPLIKAETLPYLFERCDSENIERWQKGKEFASGESTLIGRRNDPPQDTNKSLHLPPIHSVMVNINSREKKNNFSPESKRDQISVKQKITELKMSQKSTNAWMQGKRNTSASNSRNDSPSSGSPIRSPEESLLCDAAARGCEVLCVEVLRRLRSVSWMEVVDTLEELPKVLDKFWGVITEHRIADLIRHVCSHVESPRTQVAKAACNTLASILKTTNYTKKPYASSKIFYNYHALMVKENIEISDKWKSSPIWLGQAWCVDCLLPLITWTNKDFYEAVGVLLTKTGSFSRPVRRAANIALDCIVCGVEFSHAVTAICVHGVDHKSPLVRCAASRLLVVSCALAGGGREILRTRPQSAVCARKHALQALAAFLCDKNTETRKYAERLYSMLRPLTNFEAYYLTDVEVEVATSQMKKYDHLLLCGPPKSNR